jgi:hypothetical protein
MSVDDSFDQKLDGIHELTSQAYEGGASGSAEYVAKDVPPADNEVARRAWLKRRWGARQSSEAEKYRDLLVKLYGEEKGKAVKYAETFEVCEYGRRPSAAEIKQLFPFYDQK